MVQRGRRVHRHGIPFCMMCVACVLLACQINDRLFDKCADLFVV